MIYYHGSVAEGITKLLPFAKKNSNLPFPCVYLTTSRALAPIYIWDKPFKWMNYFIRKEDGAPVYTESFPNALAVFYKGVRGWVYVCQGEYEQNGTGISCAAISKEPVEVFSAERIPDAYEELLRLEKEGKLCIQRYETLTQEQLESEKRMTLNTIKNRELLKNPEDPLALFIREYMPQYWREAEKAAASEAFEASFSPQPPAK